MQPGKEEENSPSLREQRLEDRQQECSTSKEGEEKSRAEQSKYGGESGQKFWKSKKGEVNMVGEDKRVKGKMNWIHSGKCIKSELKIN